MLGQTPAGSTGDTEALLSEPGPNPHLLGPQHYNPDLCPAFLISWEAGEEDWMRLEQALLGVIPFLTWIFLNPCENLMEIPLF